MYRCRLRARVGLRGMWTLMIIPFALNYHMLRVHPRRLELSTSTMWIRLCNKQYIHTCTDAGRPVQGKPSPGPHCMAGHGCRACCCTNHVHVANVGAMLCASASAALQCSAMFAASCHCSHNCHIGRARPLSPAVCHCQCCLLRSPADCVNLTPQTEYFGGHAQVQQ